MNRIILSITMLLACSLQAVTPTQQDIYAKLSKSIAAANVVNFETTFNAHTITAQEKKDLENLARVTRAKIQAEFDAMGKSTGNAATFLTGLGQGVVGLWALVNVMLTGVISVRFRKDETELIESPTDFLLPCVRLPFCLTLSAIVANPLYSPNNSNDSERIIEFKPPVAEQLPRLWAGCALTALPLGALTGYAFYKAAINISRGLNYKNYLKAQIANLDVIIQYLA
jgi:hypothetical protein